MKASLRPARRTGDQSRSIMIVVTLLLSVLFCITCQGDPSMKAQTLRRAAVAGSWYPGTRAALEREITAFLEHAPLVRSGAVVRALIAPHAGYAYSGRCAGASFKQLAGQRVERVFLIGPSHYVAFNGVASILVDAFETPLGQIPLDRRVLDALRAHPLVQDLPRAHDREHALELELPFLQVVLGNFKLIPLIIGQLSAHQAREIGALIRKQMGPHDIIVASTDFTHYGAAFGFAPFHDNVKDRLTALDMGAVDLILKKDIDGIFTYARETGITWDGITVAPVMLAALPASAEGALIMYYKSGDSDKKYDHSVSYVSLAFYDGTAATSSPNADVTAEQSPPVSDAAVEPLNTAERTTLLALARDTLTMHVNGKGMPDLEAYTLTPRLREKAGAFVTLHKHNALRGCIGYIEGIKPLAETVRENACNAATRDPRFPPVKPAELKDIHIEISVMSPLRKVSTPEHVTPGVHGVVLKKGWRQGVFLPQVATEQGWDRVTFLQNLGLKAGLDTDAYLSADLYVFTADVFSETVGREGKR
jgi:hypothetical protein